MRAVEPRRWAVIGGGVTGLEVARQLASRRQRVTLFESAPQVGGLADSWELGDVRWDRHYHVILEGDRRLRTLLHQLGLESELVWRTTRTGFLTGGRLHSMSDSLDFLRFPALGPIAKLRLAATLVWAARFARRERLERIPVEDWLARWSGASTVEHIWRPLLRSKLGDLHASASAAFIQAIIRRLYEARRTGMKTERFGYVSGGYATILAALGEHLRELDVEIETSCRVARVRSDRDLACALTVETDRGVQTFDRVVSTLPAPAIPALAPELTEDELAALSGMPHLGVLCVSLLLDRPLAGFYVTNITDDGHPFTGIIEMTALVDPGQLGGRHLVYLPRYLAPDHPWFDRPEEELTERFFAGLRRIYPDLHERNLLAARVSRARCVLPVNTVEAAGRRPPIITSIPGFYTLGSAQIVDGTLNVDETLRSVDRGLGEVLRAERELATVGAPASPGEPASLERDASSTTRRVS